MAGSILSILLSVVAGTVVGIAAAVAWAWRLSETAPKSAYHRAKASILFAGGVTTGLTALLWVPADTTLEELSATTGLPESLPLLHALLSLFPAVVGVLAFTSRPHVPGDARHIARRSGVALVILTLIVAATVGVLRIGELALPMFVVVLTVVICALLPDIRRRQFSTRAPEEAEQRWLANALDTTTFSVDRVRVVEGTESETFWRPMRVGFGRFAELFVPSDAFETYDDEVLEAMVIRLTLPARNDWFLPSYWAVWIGVLVFLNLTSNETVMIVGLLVLVASVAVATIVGRHLTYRGDAEAAEIVGPGPLIESIEGQLDEFGGESRLSTLLLLRPSAHSRIERLESMVDERPGDRSGNTQSTD